MGVITLVVVLMVIGAVALVRRRYDGRVRHAAPAQAAAVSNAPSLRDFGVRLPAEQIAVVQFSGQFCASCPQARTLVERVLLDNPGVGYVDVDVAENLDAVRAFGIRRTPTLIITDRHGRAVHRASGMPREAELRQALSALAAAL